MQGFKVHLKLRDQKLKTIKYIYRLLYENLMVTTNQILIIDIHTKKKKESKQNTKVSHQITRGQKRKARKTNPKQLIKWQ